MFKTYYQLAKPGIVYGNVFTALAAFLFASRWSFGWGLFIATMAGIGLVIASACVFNNYLDREMDKKMERTKTRALASGTISATAALAYASALGIVGFVLLFAFVNILTGAVALVGFIVYVCAYTPLKRRTSLALYVGAVAGAMPILAGYTAVTDRLDSTAVWLFVFLFLWQLPHFIAIAVYRFDEYGAAGVPLVVRKIPTEGRKRVARKLFLLSLIVLVAFCIALALWPLLS